MKIAKVLLVLFIIGVMVCGTTVFIGCDEAANMMKPVITEKPEKPQETPKPDPEKPKTEEPKQPSEEPPSEEPETPKPPEDPEEPEPPEPLSEEEAIAKAKRIAIQTAEHMQAIEGGTHYQFEETISEDAEKVLIENTGLTWDHLGGLVNICLHLADEFETIREFGGFSSFIDVLANYLELTYRYPTKSNRDIVEIFKQRCAAREVTIVVHDVFRKYYGDNPALLDELLQGYAERVNQAR